MTASEEYRFFFSTELRRGDDGDFGISYLEIIGDSGV